MKAKTYFFFNLDLIHGNIHYFIFEKLTYQKFFDPKALKVLHFFLKQYKNAYGVYASCCFTNFPEFQTSILLSYMLLTKVQQMHFCFNTNLRCNIHFFREHFAVVHAQCFQSRCILHSEYFFSFHLSTMQCRSHDAPLLAVYLYVNSL